MIHLKYKCKVNFVKLPLIWIDPCLKLVFENATADRNTGCRSVLNCASCSFQLLRTHSDAVCGIQNATKQCISRYHLHTGLCYCWSAMDKTLDRRRLAHLITNFQRCRHQSMHLWTRCRVLSAARRSSWRRSFIRTQALLMRATRSARVSTLVR